MNAAKQKGEIAREEHKAQGQAMGLDGVGGNARRSQLLRAW